MGGYRVQAKSVDAIQQIKTDAKALEEAGAGVLVLEGIPREVATEITAELTIPTIGIGAGPDCDGQILVFHDMVNLSFAPRQSLRGDMRMRRGCSVKRLSTIVKT